MSALNLKEEFIRDPQQFVSRKEAAFLLGCAVSTITRYAAEGRLKALRIGKRRLLIYRPSVWTLLLEL